MKNILGLDLGTNSIGWAVVKSSDDLSQVFSIEGAGSRIIPMDAATLGDFDKGNSISQTSERTRLRGVRRLFERAVLRRERLNRVLDIMGFLPKHYACCLNRYGKFLEGEEPKLAWVKGDDGKFHFLFEHSFREMLAEMSALHIGNCSKKVPYDWTIYYLRKKALTKRIEKEELAWILHQFNQKRGYNQSRDEEVEERKGKVEEYFALKVVKVEATDEKKGKDLWYNVHLENGWIYRRTSKEYLDWEGKIKEFIVTTDINSDGTPKLDKDGKVKRSFRVPSEDDWTLIKKKSEQDLKLSDKTVGEYIYDALCSDNSIKIKGGLIRTIDRSFYRDELLKIVQKQAEYHPELRDSELYEACISALYETNVAYRESILQRDFSYLLVDDILFYQRPLKSKKHLISDCQFEVRYDGNGNRYGVKTVPKSHPLYAEFRLWQFIDNLHLFCNEMEIDGVVHHDVDITTQFLATEADKVRLFEYLYSLKSINQSQLFAFLFGGRVNKDKYRWNYVDKDYPCNETRYDMLKVLKECNSNIVLNPAYNNNRSGQSINEVELWHLLYSIDDKRQLQAALRKFGKRNGLPIEFADIAGRIKPYKKEYGAYSLKALCRLLPLMRKGYLWRKENIDMHTAERIEKIINGEFDEAISNRVREKAIKLTDENDFRGLPLWLACYVVYNRHSEVSDNKKWRTPEDVRSFVNQFKQHSLRNPIVETVVLETLRTVADVWEKYGEIDEIHLELGREMKNPADKRAETTLWIQENEATNLRIRRMLVDFMNPEFDVEAVRPDSPSHIELLKLYEEYVLADNKNEIPDEIQSIIAKYNQAEPSKQPTRSEALRYKLWLEQGYRSPYTGENIPLGKLFTAAYEIEHIIPQSRYFDDSFSNKVICESEVNKLKDNKLGLEFVKENHGRRVQIGSRYITIFEVADYEDFVRKTYGKSPKTKAKMNKLLMDDIPDGFIERQLNDSRYISKYIKALLSNIVRDEDETEATSKHLIVCSGGVTDRLKKDWGINDKWNNLILPRFIRLNNLTGSSAYTYVNSRGNIVPNMPLHQMKGFNKKRIDHRHHAMDAIVIACTTRNHVNLLNNESALSLNKANRYALQRKLRRMEHKTISRQEKGKLVNMEVDVAREFLLPWATFPQDVYNALSNIIVSFKSNNRVLNKASNKYERFVDGKKRLVSQTDGDMLVVRKALHKDTVFGRVNLQRIKHVKLKDAIKTPKAIVDKILKETVLSLQEKGYDNKKMLHILETKHAVTPDNIAVFYFTDDTRKPMVAVRKDVLAQFADIKDKKKALSVIESITDTAIQKIMKNHLQNEGDNPELAFSADGIDRMNENIWALNGGKEHLPIYRARFTEIQGSKYPISQYGAKASKYVEAAKGTNLFYGVYVDDNGKRSYDTISLVSAVASLELGLPPVPITNEKGHKLMFQLSPNDLVYVPTAEELESGHINVPLDTSRVYKTVSFTEAQSFFVPVDVAKSIIDKFEFSALNKMERAVTGEMIKEICVPVKVDRLGNIISITKI